ncbi:NAD(P)-binding protein [Tricholoma matsutake]|nr:NAD(P)-binding protein [Tricholoma matsutake 945]
MSSPLTYTRVAIVTGAGQGIGRAIALRLAADGLDIAVVGLSSGLHRLEDLADEIKKMDRKSIVIACDVSKEDEVKSMVDQTVAELGRLDAMVANAGISQPTAGSTIDADLKAFERIWTTNVLGTLLCYKYAAKQMVKQGSGGRIVGASSISGLKGMARTGGYGVSKAAIVSLTQTTALELAEHNITVNVYAPGLISTRMIASEADQHFGGERGSALQRMIGMKIPNVKIGQPEDVAGSVSYLLSPEAHFVTGQTVCMDGGLLLNFL